MAVRACRIAAAHKKPVEVCMVMISQNGNEPVLPGECMDLLEGLLGTVSPVEEVTEIDKDIDGPEMIQKERRSDTFCKRANCCRISVHVRKNYCTHTGNQNISLLSHINQ